MLATAACVDTLAPHRTSTINRVICPDGQLCANLLSGAERRQSFSFVRRLPYRAGARNLDAACWAGVGQSSMEETAGDTVAVGEA